MNVLSIPVYACLCVRARAHKISKAGIFLNVDVPQTDIDCMYLCNRDSVDELMSKPDIDGCLVGGASLDAKKFARIMNFQV
jgi:hypothetical protein